MVHHVGRLLDGHHGSAPLELVNGGDLLLLVERMLHLRGLDTVRITEVSGHADEGMVLDGRVGELDRLGNNAADEAADFGRGRVGDAVINARRSLSGVCCRWYPVIFDLHWFFIAISRAVVNHDGNDGTAPDPLVWSSGALPKRRRLVHAVRDRAMLLGPPHIWELLFWFPCIGLLVVWILGWVVYRVLNCSFFMSFGLRGCLWKRPILVIFDQGVQFQCRLFRLVQALIVGAPVVSLVL